MDRLELIGSEVAEMESEELSDIYVENIYYDKASSFSKSNRELFFIGRTGSGKSAILEMIRHKKGDEARVIDISEEDFAVQLLLSSEEVTNISPQFRQLAFKTLWKYIIITNILKKIYGGDTHKWSSLIYGEGKEARELLKIFGELSINQQTLTDQIFSFLQKIQQISIMGVGVTKESNNSATNDIYSLFKILRNFEKESLASHVKGKFIYVLIDDLDKNWMGTSDNVDLIKCLFDCIVELGTSFYGDIKFVVALRTDIFKAIGFHQTEKIRPYVIELKWTNWQLKDIVERRLCSYWGVSAYTAWNRFPKHIKNEKVEDYFITRTMRRPRDVISFVNLTIREANTHHQRRITELAIDRAEKEYSRLRMEALYDEWKFVYPELLEWIEKFAGQEYILNYETIREMFECEDKTIKEIIDALYQVGFLGFITTKDENIENKKHKITSEDNIIKFKFLSKGAPGYNHIFHVNVMFISYLSERAEELGVNN